MSEKTYKYYDDAGVEFDLTLHQLVVLDPHWACSRIEQAESLEQQLSALRHAPCGVCAGEGVPISGRPCICGGVGTETAEINGLRLELSALRAAAKTVVDAAMDYQYSRTPPAPLPGLAGPINEMSALLPTPPTTEEDGQ